MKLEFGYGATVQTVALSKKNCIGVLHANPVPHLRTGAEAVSYALAHPIGAGRLRDCVRPSERVAIIVSDITRPVPSRELLPPLLAELSAAGVEADNIRIVFALGSHRRHTEAEQRQLVGDAVFESIRCVDSDPEDCILLGTTKNGTPVAVTRSVAEADFRIATGNIEFHYFAGYSWGAKALMPGVSTHDAIQANHRLMVLPEACAGCLEGNPIREDIEEAGEIAGLDYILNVVLDEHRHIVYAVAGDKTAAHREGCRYLDRMYRKQIPARADIVLVSQGGTPKDANLYQTQKALDNAKHAVKDGGTIILIGACPEGLGSAVFEEWLLAASRPQDLTERIGKQFELGGHKAAAMAMVMEHARIDLVSELPDDLVRRIFLHPQPDAQTALNEAFSRYGRDATVLAMPFGGATLPFVD